MSEKIYLLPKGQKFYKANLHSHSTVSDGRLTPLELKSAYQKAGYSILALTDHMRYQQHPELNDENFVALAAVEVGYVECAAVGYEKAYHINFYDKTPELRKDGELPVPIPTLAYEDKDGINQYVEALGEHGFLACYNHPYWSLQTYEDYIGLKGFFAMEIYNHGCEHDGLYGYQPQVYDEMLRYGEKIYCVATDDNHNLYGFDHPLCDSFGGFIMVSLPKLSYQNVVQALEHGHFYSSMGPEIKELYIEGDVLTVTCSPVKKIFVKTMGRDCYKEAASKDETLTKACFPLTGKEGYIRVVCQDACGHDACSNAYQADTWMGK